MPFTNGNDWDNPIGTLRSAERVRGDLMIHRKGVVRHIGNNSGMLSAINTADLEKPRMCEDQPGLPT